MTCHPGPWSAHSTIGDRIQLRLPVALHAIHVHALHEVVVLGDFASTGSAQALSARFRYTFMLFSNSSGALVASRSMSWLITQLAAL